jgi:hypothetical protein
VLKPVVRRRVPVLARALLLVLLVVGLSGMHSLAGGGTSGTGTMPLASSSSTSASGAAAAVLVGTSQALPGSAATESAAHSMGHDCVAVLIDAPGVALGPLLPVAALSGDVVDGAPASALLAGRAAADRGPDRPAPSLAELSILRV